MELKQDKDGEPYYANKSFNRTFMELKQDKDGEPYYANKSFNRTFMELKHEQYRDLRQRNEF